MKTGNKFVSLNVYLDTRKKLKQMALDREITIAELIVQLVNEAEEYKEATR